MSALDAETKTWCVYLQVDVAYAPFIERFRLILSDVMNVDITTGRPNLTLWIQVKPLPQHLYISFIVRLKFPHTHANLVVLRLFVQEINKIEAYTETRQNPQELVERYKKRVAEARL